MKVLIHANQVQWQREYLPRFIAGFKKHGAEVDVTDRDMPAGGDVIDVVFANNSWRQTVARAGHLINCLF